MTERRVEYWIITTPAGKEFDFKASPPMTFREVQAMFTGSKCEPSEDK